MTIKSVERVSTWEKGKEAIKFVYDWKNNSSESTAASLAFYITGYQNGIELDNYIYSEDIDISMIQKNVQPGFIQENCEGGIGIEGDSEIEVHIRESFSSYAGDYIFKINPKNL